MDNNLPTKDKIGEILGVVLDTKNENQILEELTNCKKSQRWNKIAMICVERIAENEEFQRASEHEAKSNHAMTFEKMKQSNLNQCRTRSSQKLKQNRPDWLQIFAENSAVGM